MQPVLIRVGPAPLLLCTALLLPGSARANGQTSHLWISDTALDHLPEGELRALLTRDDLQVMLRNGSMFPDGGYAVGDGYGEIAHWEPLQTAYLEWIRETYEPPWTDEAARHVAFLLGMASHGIADQTYDSMYLERAKAHDADSPWDTESMDEATDVAFAAEAGAWEVPALWVPADVLAPLFDQVAGHAVDPDTLEAGQAMLGFAVWGVGEMAGQPETVAAYHEQFPWACAHQLDAAVPGSPPVEAEVVAAYWQRLWARLHGDESLDDPLLAHYPRAGEQGHPTGADDIEAMVSFVIVRGLDAATVGPQTVVVEDADGPVAASVDLFYGQGSHAIDLRPVDGWSPAREHTVTIGPGLRTFDGVDVPGPVQFTFDTTPPPDPPADDPGGCQCTSGSRSSATPLLLLIAVVAASRLFVH